MRNSVIHSLVSDTERPSLDIGSAYRGPVQLWMVRVLWSLQGHRHVGYMFNIDADDVVAAIGLTLEEGDNPDDALNADRLAKRHQELVSEAQPAECILTRNLAFLDRSLRFSKVERAILEFCLLLRKSQDLLRVTELVGDSLTLGETSNALAVILELPISEVREALKPDSRLRQCGLLRVDKRPGGLGSKITLLSQMLDALSIEHEAPSDLLKYFVDSSDAPLLRPRDFEDYKSDYALLSAHLRSAVTTGRVGCNVLIHGEPGVGKTQFVRTLCRDLGISLFEIKPEDWNGEPLSTTDRLSGFQLSKQFLGDGRNVAILFDEVDDVFPAKDLPWLFGKAENGQRKGWINNQLENNKIPVFWLANSVGHIDPAHLRRFDVVFEMRPMSPSARKKLLSRMCRQRGIRGGRWITKAAEHRHLSPALIEKITSVVSETASSEHMDHVSLFERVANGAFSAMGAQTIKLQESKPILPYSVDVLCADANLADLVEGLRRVGSGRILCYGPPGTGKTAFARHVAEQLELPLLEFRASDIFGPYVGVTEQNIAAAFRQAREEGGIMLFDEVDSLLRSREGANQSWEVSQVNELLVQLEDHPGIVFACTNFRDGLDGAAARRFDRKVGFGYMTPKLAWDFFKRTLTHNKAKSEALGGEIEREIKALRQLTPGDFKSAVRNISLGVEGVTPARLLNALRRECSSKEPRHGKAIGFLADITEFDHHQP